MTSSSTWCMLNFNGFEKGIKKMPEINGERLLQLTYDTEKRANSFYNNQMLDHLNKDMREFVAKQEMVFISTADSKGNCDASFRSGTEGFVRIMDEHTIMYPEYRGNGVMASLGNIVENPHIGLLFLDFIETGIGLHINGEASILENEQMNSWIHDEEFMAEIKAKEGIKPERWVVIKVEEAYIHCSKHIPQFKKLPKDIQWGTDEEAQKGGDFFKVKQVKNNIPFK